MGEAAAVFAVPGAVKKVRGEIRSLDQLRDMLEARKPVSTVEPIPRGRIPLETESAFSPEWAAQLKAQREAPLALPPGQGFTMPEGTPYLPEVSKTIRLPYEPVEYTKAGEPVEMFKPEAKVGPSPREIVEPAATAEMAAESLPHGILSVGDTFWETTGGVKQKLIVRKVDLENRTVVVDEITNKGHVTGSRVNVPFEKFGLEFAPEVLKPPELQKPPGATSGGKQPWEMTRDQFIDSTPDHSYMRNKVDRMKPDEGGYYYHVVPEDYKVGDPILSAKKLGLSPEDMAKKWPDADGYHELPDYGKVSLFNNLPSAEKFNGIMYEGKGKVLKILPSEYNDITANYDRFASVAGIAPKEIVGEISHRSLVKQALSEGKPVPPEVLKDYPELKPKAIEPEVKQRSELPVKVKQYGDVRAVSIPEEGYRLVVDTPYQFDKIDHLIEVAPDAKQNFTIGKTGSKWNLYDNEKQISLANYPTKEAAKEAQGRNQATHGKYNALDVPQVTVVSPNGARYKIWFTKETLTDFKSRVNKEFPGKQSTTLFGGIPGFAQMADAGKWIANTGPARKLASFFQPELGVPQGKEWLYSRQEAQGMVALGEQFADSFVKKHKNLKPEERQLIWEQMDSGADISTLPKALQGAAQEFRILDNSLGKMLVDEGLMSEETFQANMGKHIRYIYNIHQQGGDFSAGMGQKINTKFLTERKDLTALERQRLGLVKDPIQAIATSIGDTYRAVGMSQHFKGIAENPNWVFEPAQVVIDGKKMGIGKVQKMLDAYTQVEKSGQLNPEQIAYRKQLEGALQEAQAVKVPKDYIQLNGSQYGALDGQYVRKAIAQDIKPVLDVFKSSSETANKVVSGIVTANGLWKMKNVALNIPTMSRNIVSNHFQLLMSGMRPDRVITRTQQSIYQHITKGKYHDEALRQGLFKTNFTTGELEEIVRVARTFDANHWVDFTSKIQSLGKFYGKIDDVFKLAKFIDLREAGKPIPESARLANKWVMDYSLAHPAIKMLRNSPIGAPFISYQYKIAPLIVESMAKRPWVLGTLMSLPWLVQKAVTKEMTDEDAKRYIESLPEHVKSGTVFLIPGIHGMNALDVSYMVPWGNWFQVGGSIQEGKASQAFKELGIASGLLPTILYGVTTGKDLFTGRDIVSDLEKYDPKATAWALTKWMWTQAVPPMLTENSVAGKVSEHLQHGQTSKGLKTEGMNIWPRIGGVNIYPVDPAGKARGDRYEIGNVRKALLRKMFDRNITAEERQAAYMAYRSAIGKIRQYAPPQEESSLYPAEMQ